MNTQQPENIQLKTPEARKVWQTPEITVLKQSKTESGSYPAMSEDFGGTIGTS